MTAIVRLTPGQKARLRPLVRDLERDAHLLDNHLRDDASVRLIREDLEALRRGADEALRALGWA